MVVGVAMVKDEIDVIGPVLRHMVAQGCDALIVADNLSTDGTRDLLCDLAHDLPLCVEDDPVVAYTQSLKMTRLAHEAGSVGADWVVPFDADEVIYSPDGRTLVDVLADAHADIVSIVGMDHVVTPLDDDGDPNPLTRIGWRRTTPQSLPKVAFRYVDRIAVHMGNHDVSGLSTRQGGLELRHFQYRSLAQMTRKLRQGKVAYDASDIHPMHGTHWREGGLLSDVELAERWEALLREDGLVFDPAPVKP